MSSVLLMKGYLLRCGRLLCPSCCVLLVCTCVGFLLVIFLSSSIISRVESIEKLRLFILTYSSLGFSSLRNFASFLLTIHFFTLHSTLSLCCYTFLLLAGFVLTLVLHKPPTSHSSRSLSWIRFRVIQPLSFFFSFSFASLFIRIDQR